MEWLSAGSGGIYLDGTVGEGGHSEAILEASKPNGVVLGIDRDPRSVDAARRRLTGYGDRAQIVHGSYADMADLARQAGIERVDGVLLDLGFSSRQVDSAGYGLSFQRDESLDMRYDTAGPTAADLLNHTDERELADVIYRYGEERRSRAIARAIVAARPITTTGRLAAVVARALGGRRGSRHPGDPDLSGAAHCGERGAGAPPGRSGRSPGDPEAWRPFGGDQLPQPGGQAGQGVDGSGSGPVHLPAGIAGVRLRPPAIGAVRASAGGSPFGQRNRQQPAQPERAPEGCGTHLTRRLQTIIFPIS